MRVRDAVEADAEAMAAIADGPTDVMENLVHDRTVSVAESDAAESDAAADDSALDSGVTTEDEADAETRDAPGGDGEALLGFVSYDANESVVHVTQIDGTIDACERLLAEPVRFAAAEGMRVELLVTDPDGVVASAAERVGFERDGAGPRFDGETTVRYDLHPT